MQLSALLFDVDGTLADTERDGHRVAFNAAFKAAGLDWEWSPALYGQLLEVTGGKERIRHYLNTVNTDFHLPDDGDTFIASLHAEKTRFYTELLGRGEVPLRPGVERLLNEAREQGLRMGIATTTTPANVTALIENTLGADAMRWFEVIAAGDIVPAKKPAPDIFQYAMQQMRLVPDECLAFEDSGNGIRSSTAAGLKTLVTINGYTRDHDFSDAVSVLDHLGDPGNCCRSLAGMPPSAGFVDVAYCQQLHAQS